MKLLSWRARDVERVGEVLGGHLAHPVVVERAVDDHRPIVPPVELAVVTTVLLVRHGRTTANGAGVLAGWTEGVGLDDAGRDPGDRAGGPAGRRTAGRRGDQPAAALPGDRRPDARRDTTRCERHVDERLGEVRYGDWTGRELKKLAKDPLWKVVQAHPSAMTFPGEGGESMRDDAGPRGRRRARTGTPGSATTPSRSSSRTATSSRRCWPTRWACTWTSSSGSSSTRRSVSVVTYTRCARSWSASTTSAATSASWCPRKAPRRSRRKGAAAVRRRRRRRGRSPQRRIGSIACLARLRVRPAGALRRRHRRRARRSAPSSCRPAAAAGSPASRWRSSRWRCSPSGSRSCSTRSCAAPAARPTCPPSHRPRPSDTRPAGRADRGGVPGRHDGAGLGRRRRAGRHRGPGGRPRTRTTTTTTAAHRRRRGRAAAAAGPAHRRRRPRLRQARRGRRRGRPPAVPVLRRPAGPGGHICPRANGYRR